MNMEVEDMKANNYSLLHVSINIRNGLPRFCLTQKLPVNNEMLKKAALANRYKMGTIV
jgi:hypothetical protein